MISIYIVKTNIVRDFGSIVEGEEAYNKKIHGSWEESDSLLPSYIVQLLRDDPAMLTRLIREAA